MAVPGNGWSATTVFGKSYKAEKTILHLLGQEKKDPFSIVEFGLSSAGTTGTLKLEMYTANGKTQAGTTVTPVRIRASANVAEAGTAALENLSAEPETIVVVKRWLFTLPMAPFVLQEPLGREPGPLTGEKEKAGIAVGFKVTLSTEAECVAYVEFEE